MAKVKLHFGCGDNKLRGWINVDRDGSCRPDVIADLRHPVPFQSQSVDILHSEDFVDQLELDRAYQFFTECHRILKRGGIMRVLTPDLHEFARRYVHGDAALFSLWKEQVGLPLRTKTLGEIFNLGMRLGGHTFLYDEETLFYVLRECGFEPKKVSYRDSEDADLRDLDLRSPETGVSLYVEARKRDLGRGEDPSPKRGWIKSLLTWR